MAIKKHIDKVSISRCDNGVLFIINDKVCVIHYAEIIDKADQMIKLARGSLGDDGRVRLSSVEKGRSIRFSSNGVEVQVDLNGVPITHMPYGKLVEVANGLKGVALQIRNETEDPQKLIKDQAILMRAGVPIDLTLNNKKMLDEALKSAQWDSDLRKAIKASVESTAVVGSPIIKSSVESSIK